MAVMGIFLAGSMRVACGGEKQAEKIGIGIRCQRSRDETLWELAQIRRKRRTIPSV